MSRVWFQTGQTTRFDLSFEKDESDIFSESLLSGLKSGGLIKVLCVPSGAKSYSNTALKKGDIYNEAIKSGAKGMESTNKEQLLNSVLCRTRALHQPFTAPTPEDMKDLSSARALAYDMVSNGVEIGGGSLRIYKREFQQKVLGNCWHPTPNQLKAKFGVIFCRRLENMGAPPHGGIAYGLERLAMRLAGANSIRDVICIPKDDNRLSVPTILGAPSEEAPQHP
ncbi:Aspartate--tRNA ligase [Populus alba x Populus x berolinensis]|nr:Aspartate--tRNA ligase [Populus alba x Populus x berolinensis]